MAFIDPFQPKPFWDLMVLLRQIVASLDGFISATAPVLVALQLNEVKTSSDVFRPYSRLNVPASLLMLQIR